MLEEAADESGEEAESGSDDEYAPVTPTAEVPLCDWVRAECTRLRDGDPATKSAPYPGELILLYQKLMAREVAPSSMSGVVRDTLESFATLLPEELAPYIAKIRLPDATTARDWRLGLEWHGLVHTAALLARATKIVLHADLTSKDQVKYGTAVLALHMPDGSIDAEEQGCACRCSARVPDLRGQGRAHQQPLPVLAFEGSAPRPRARAQDHG